VDGLTDTEVGARGRVLLRTVFENAEKPEFEDAPRVTTRIRKYSPRAMEFVGPVLLYDVFVIDNVQLPSRQFTLSVE